MSPSSNVSIASRALFPPLLLAVVMIGIVVLFWTTYRAIEDGNRRSVSAGRAVEQARQFVDALHLGHTGLYRAISLKSQGVEQRIVSEATAAALSSLDEAAQALTALAGSGVVTEVAHLERTRQAFDAYLVSAREAADFVETEAFVAAMYMNGADRRFHDAQANATAIGAALAAHRERIDQDAAAALAGAFDRIGIATALAILLSLAVAASFARMFAAQARAVAETTAANAKLRLAYGRLERQSGELTSTARRLETALGVAERAEQEARKAHADLQLREESFRLLFDANPIPMWVYDGESLKFLAVNDAAVSHYGYRREDFLAMSILDIRPPEDRDTLRRVVSLPSAGRAEGRPARHLKADGTLIEVAIYSRRLRYKGRNASLIAVIDVTERKAAQARIAHLAYHDPLTDLPNRAAFNAHLAAAFDAAEGSPRELAILCLDLDRFKEINDVFGHGIADALLCRVAERLSAAAHGAFVARLGGDEFVLVMSEGPQPTGALALADRILAAMADEFEIDGRRIGAGLSIGIAVCPQDGADPESILGNAGAALDRAKADSGGTVRFFEAEMDRELREKRALQHDLRLAVVRSELLLYYQPQARIGGEIVGFEALARWRHPARGLVASSLFIALAEENGTIVPMGEWILREACREAASWPRPLQLAVNLSPVQFLQGDLAGMVHAALLETGLAPARLELEITEGIFIRDCERAIAILRRLKALGVRIAMDDFGTGYSSLSYLQRFPFDKIKIDRVFVSHIEHSAQSAAIIRAVIGLGRGLHLPVTAEGVETAEQLAFLSREACDEVQGYLIGRPAPIGDYAPVVGRDSAALAGRDGVARDGARREVDAMGRRADAGGYAGTVRVALRTPG
jgi:diguanylate cyclase (GGDEF)-like protein/PAS domain S-box-containing protein